MKLKAFHYWATIAMGLGVVIASWHKTGMPDLFAAAMVSMLIGGIYYDRDRT